VFDGLQHLPVWPDENQVAVPSNQLSHEPTATGFSIEVERNDPLPSWLRDIYQLAASDPLPQQEEQGRGGFHSTAGLLRHQERARVLRGGRDEQLETLAGVELEPHGSLIWQHDALHAGPEEPVEPVAQAGQRQVIDVHGRVSLTTENVVAGGNDALGPDHGVGGS
jgi:hypothetical protein